MNLTIPVFLAIRVVLPPTRKGRRLLPDALVAAIRWDYEYGLMRMAAVGRKYSSKATLSVVRDICRGRTYKEIKARCGA